MEQLCSPQEIFPLLGESKRFHTDIYSASVQGN